MALYKKSDFAALCSLTTSNLGNYIKRKQVFLSGDLIDDQIPQNAAFLKKRQEKNTGGGADSPEAETKPKENLKLQDPDLEFPAPKPGKKKQNSEDVSYYELEKQKLELEISKKTEEIEILKNKNAKQQGDVIPFALIPPLFEQQARAFATNFRNGLDLFLIKVQQIADLDREQAAKLKGEQLDMINASIKNSFDDMEKVIEKIAADFSQSKGVGERN